LFTILAILSVAIRIAAALYLGDSVTGAQQERIADQVSYHALAQSLVEGRGYSFTQHWYPFTYENHPTAHWSFLYPLYLAGVYLLFGVNPLAARLIQVVISGLLSTWLYFRLGRRLFGEAAGLAGAAFAAFYAYFILYDAALMTESFFILGIVAMLDLSLGLSDRGKPAGLKDWLPLGGVLGVTVLLRQAILPWLPILFLWLAWAGTGSLWQRIRGPVLSMGVVALFILPWTIRNWIVYDAFLPLNSNAGYALYSSNHPAQGTDFDQGFAAPLPVNLQDSTWPNEAWWNNELTRQGIQFIVEDPQRYLLLSLSRVPVFFNFWFTSESTLLSGVMRLLSYGIYLPFFLMGAVLSWRKIGRGRLIYLFAVVYSLMHILTWASVRYRLPVDAACMPVAGLALAALAQRVQAAWGQNRLVSANRQDGNNNLHYKERA
jgi:4-amino-4-deoxy-L-arabinose transferase-like glycosyltransferase